VGVGVTDIRPAVGRWQWDSGAAASGIACCMLPAAYCLVRVCVSNVSMCLDLQGSGGTGSSNSSTSGSSGSSGSSSSSSRKQRLYQRICVSASLWQGKAH
jgi:hypothetical protein